MIKSVYNNKYVSKHDKIKIVKYADSGKKGSPGFYVMHVQQNGKGEWFELININCKTGWYHG
ncbi:hypothetical protein [Bacillus xiapuensis]|uniref:SH3b domain-containing protein n=1 Tax=Bacillus xiapuensis TaxID=2014075 RepID=A0ABU6N7B7_9BACI|nr:hypothetical protein [Bacillus xiapuensis]